ncbi:MAG: glutamine-hydrolyzing GMP synthase [Candidatus Latescibacteria bacterium]|nr:glutamine-hydrolyzing GMP synthase [Candidatus Latescibacterota bacterium]
MDRIIVLDFGGQYCHLISRRIRDLGVYSEVKPASTTKQELFKIPNLKGIILSGGAASVYDKTSPKCSKDILKFKIPVLGICYGHHLIAHLDKGEVLSGTAGEYGVTELTIKKSSKLLKGFSKGKTLVWMNHKDVVKKLPTNYSVIACTKNSPIAVFEDNQNKIYGVQFHPEVTHTTNGMKILKNFVFDICGAKREWDTSQVINSIKQEIKDVIGKRKAVIGLSGGVDSSTAAILVKEVIGKNLIAVYVDTGLMRYQETEFMRKVFTKHKLNLKIVDASDRFFKALKGVTEPEKKRKIIGKLFIDVFDQVAIQEKAKVLIQGTIYSDRIESGITQHSSIIKSHHNVGGLPENMMLEVFEPLKNLYKDEVRKIARKIGLSDEITKRHVFPGPGLAIRIVGDITPKKAEITRKASYIIEQELKKVGLYEKVWMAFAVLLPIKSVGIQGDARSYKFPIVIRIIESKDAMTANFAKIPYEILEKISTRITNEISEVNRVVYDISNKPPATMEWE